MAAEEYRPRSVLLTGGAGFIASHVTIKLVQRYPDVKVRFVGCPLSGQCREIHPHRCAQGFPMTTTFTYIFMTVSKIA